MKKWIAGLLALIAISPVMAATPWQQITHPVAGSPQAIGGFANGCVIGAMPLPLESADYQVMDKVQQIRMTKIATLIRAHHLIIG